MSDAAPARKWARLLTAIGQALRWAWRLSPRWAAVNGSLALIEGVFPLVSLYLVQRIVDTVTTGLTGTAGPRAFLGELGGWLLLAGVVALIAIACALAMEYAREAQSATITDAMADLIHEKSNAVDHQYYEDPSFFDTLHRAQQDAPMRPAQIQQNIMQVGQSLVSLLGIAGLMFALNWMLALALIVVACPTAWVRIRYARKFYRFDIEQTEAERRSGYYHWLLTDPFFSKEIRLFDLGDLFRARFRDLRQGVREGRLALTRRRALADGATQGIIALATVGILGYTAYLTVRGTLSVGGMVMYYQGFQMGLGFFQSLLRGLTNLYEDQLFLTNLFAFLDLRPKVVAPEDPVPVPLPLRAGLTIAGVSFTYPSSDAPALRDIALTIAPGQVVALVGANGSGKTTLIKLLCRLYDPVTGTITLDGIDLRRFDPRQLRRRISVIFQDYIHYELTAAENIWVGDVHQPFDQAAVADAARRSGADAVIARLPRGYQTPLGLEFEGGHQVSIGEWQKIALARAFMRDADLFVLDEPTSALDPIAEAAIFTEFRQLIAGKSAIIISHRFSSVRMADHIYVMDAGTIVERGTHDELLRRGGYYATLYHTQAACYRETPPEAVAPAYR